MLKIILVLFSFSVLNAYSNPKEKIESSNSSFPFVYYICKGKMQTDIKNLDPEKNCEKSVIKVGPKKEIEFENGLFEGPNKLFTEITIINSQIATLKSITPELDTYSLIDLVTEKRYQIDNLQLNFSNDHKSLFIFSVGNLPQGMSQDSPTSKIFSIDNKGIKEELNLIYDELEGDCPKDVQCMIQRSSDGHLFGKRWVENNTIEISKCKNTNPKLHVESKECEIVYLKRVNDKWVRSWILN